MKRAPPESTVMSTSCSSAKHPKLDVSCNTTVNIDDITIAQDSVIIPRSYQTELVEQAKNENLIVCLPTGSGKTYIAVMLIKELAQETRKSIHDGGKRTVFLVKTVVLVQQQSDYIRIHTDLTVGTYYGDLGVDSWSKEKWINEFENHQVLVFTAQVFLNLIEHNYFRQKSSVGSTAMTAKYKRQTIKEFRSGEINVLVATAVVEEGLDIPKCNLVFRFNRPPNFSSYMQSKGRARAKQNASYVILIDGLDGKSVSNDMITYQSYEQIEKMLQEEFSIDNDDDFDTADLNQLEPYRTENGAVISAVRAAQIIYQYCAIIGNGQLCPPRILYHKTSQSTFISVLSMPANCPVSEDVKVTCGLHRKILHNSTDLFGHISSYAGDEDVFPKDQSVDQYLSKVFTLQ
ncbi:unnamed protein product [Rotaria sordida]|uniref:Uncharacterized protein n=1 Tax=Rotaria sordida TaxID=392033 RepID=A0A818XEC1_9BILA|nr:unnamed protein product [Rotaria sordida]